jgi:hypothetical protein
MRPHRLLAAGLACLAVLAGLGAAPLPADRPGPDPSSPPAPRTPLACIPAEADFFVEIRNPRRLAESLRDLDLLEQLRTFPAVQEQLESTQARRFFQLLAYFEKQLGAQWPTLLDRIAGGGMAFGAKFGDKAPALLVVQGKDEKQLARFVEVALNVIDGELARQDAKVRVVREKIEGVEVAHAGSEFYLARVGTTLLIGNQKLPLEMGLKRATGKETASLAGLADVIDSDKLLPPRPLVKVWINMAPAQASPQGMQFYKTPREIFPLTVAFGHILDILGRTPYISGGVYQTKDGFLATVRAPRGREESGTEMALFTPPAGQPTCRPLLKPRNVIYTDTFYYDFSRIWTDRAKLFVPQQVKNFEETNKLSGRFLAGAKMSDLLTQAGSYHRSVVVQQGKVGYKREPRQRVPAFALVAEMRDPEKFSTSMAGALRAAGLLATTQVKLNLIEEKHSGVEIAGYRFDESAEFKPDINDIRFNFSPCFARVGDQFLFCSTVELCRELIDLVQAEQKAPATPSPQHPQGRLASSGVARILEGVRDQLITQTILDQAVTPAEARKQVQAFIDMVRSLGSANLRVRCNENQFHFEIEYRGGK